MDQRIAPVRLPDGTAIACSRVGAGPALVYVSGWLSHLELSWALPAERTFYQALAEGRTLIRYDKPGCGLSGPTERRSPSPGPGFTERWLYAWVRHPLMLGLLITFWATPRMTVGHLVFALAATGYVAVGVHFEEQDLRRALGARYRDYADRVPAVLPKARPPRVGWLTDRHGSAAPAAGEADAGQALDHAARG